MRFIVLLQGSLIMLFLNYGVLGQPCCQGEKKADGMLALSGYDPVSYFSSDTPREGKKKWAIQYKDAVYYFSSKENKQIFQDSPDAYLPAFDGWCAYGLSIDGSSKHNFVQGNFPTNPKSYLIQDGKLLLFHRADGLDFRGLWLKDPERCFKQAQANWQKMQGSDGITMEAFPPNEI